MGEIVEKFNLQDDLIAQPISKDKVDNKNTTLCITNNYLEINFEEDAWDNAAGIVISSCRKAKKDN